MYQNIWYFIRKSLYLIKRIKIKTQQRNNKYIKQITTNCLSKSATLMADEMTFGGSLFKISSICPFASWNPGGALKTFYEKNS